LTCKHIVRQVNQCLENKPLTDLEFFAKLRRQHLPPFFRIEDIHFTPLAPEMAVRAPCRVLHMLADINLHASGKSVRSPTESSNVEDATDDHSSEPDIIISRASSPEYCNTSSLEQGSSSGVEGSGSDEEHEEVCEVLDSNSS
jgi:hypothetical protein